MEYFNNGIFEYSLTINISVNINSNIINNEQFYPECHYLKVLLNHRFLMCVKEPTRRLDLHLQSTVSTSIASVHTERLILDYFTLLTLQEKI